MQELIYQHIKRPLYFKIFEALEKGGYSIVPSDLLAEVLDFADLHASEPDMIESISELRESIPDETD